MVNLAFITTGIQLQDHFSSVLYNVCGAVNLALSSMTDLRGAMGAEMNMAPFEGARAQIDAATMALNEMNEAMQNASMPQTQASEPFQWQTDATPVFAGNGMERFRQEAQSANAMLQQLSSAQDNIARQAVHTSVLSPEAFHDIASLAVRVDHLREQVQAVSDNPVNMGTEEASAGLEQLRAQLANAIRQQGNLNAAMESGDISGINSAYLQLSQTVSNTERYIRDNTNEQGRFNQQIRDGTSASNGLMNSIKRIAAAYLSVQSMKGALGLSDELTQTTARLEMMGHGFGEAGTSGQELMQKVYESAQDARGSLSDMASVVARFGNNARDAFGSTQEVIDFANLVQKQMAIAGASTQEAANAELQLSQALGSGVLRGDELNSIFEQAPNLIQNIADYLDVPVGKIREMASEGELSADVVKAAIFSASDEINEKFSQMPMTWGQVWQNFRNSATNAFQPVLQRINDLANSSVFQNFVENAKIGLEALADLASKVFDLVGNSAGIIADNWTTVSNVFEVVGITIFGISTAIFIVTAAQIGFNAAVAACPLFWLIILIVGVVSAVNLVVDAYNRWTGESVSAVGVICGGINVVIQFFKNLLLTGANVSAGIMLATMALTYNMGAAFHNTISNIKGWFYGLLTTVALVIVGICELLNRIPFIEFDYSGVSAAASDYAAKAAAAAGDRQDYKSISGAFEKGMGIYDTFQDEWASDAYKQGYEWGAGGFRTKNEKEEETTPSLYNYPGIEGMGDNAAKTAASTGQTAANTAAIANSLDISNEQLKYLRDIAERDTVNRFTTASIKVEMTNHNNINSGMDLDGIVNGLALAVGDAMSQTAEGVHI